MNPFGGTVLITGGAGFLGRGILERAHREAWDIKFIVVSRDPQKLAVVNRMYPNVRTAICDIMDVSRLVLLMTSVDTVIHAAALKHLPECEAQPSQALRINIEGAMNVMDAARVAGVDRVVCISTDKAAAPMNMYGMSKAVIERLIFETETLNDKTTFSATRYGNVIGSTGSVWEAFKQQAATQKRLAVTNPDMTRFFVTIEEAIDVVIASYDSPAGTVTVPRARALTIGVLADYLTREWELQPAVVIGERPGEKSHEAMIAGTELERMMAHEDGTHYVMCGPMGRPKHAVTYPTPTSNEADIITASEFVQAATISEAI